jgi:hypothetical protein
MGSEPSFKRRAFKDTPLNVPPIKGNYFVVFDTCAGALGKIKIEHLRANLLGAFYQAKTLIEVINYQNEPFQERELWSIGSGAS